MSGFARPAPTGGWNARDSYTEMQPNEAIELVNLVPSGDSVRTRPGYIAHSDDIDTGSGGIETLVTYHGATETLIAGCDGDIVNITAGGAGTNLGTGFSNNRWNTTEFSNRIIFCNGTDAVQDYDGTTLTSTAIYRADVITNGTFAADSDWTKGTGWTIGSGVATKAAGTGSDLSQASVLTVSSTYRVTFTVSNRTAGTVTPYAGTAAGTARSTNDTFTEEITCAGSTSFILTADASFDGDIDDVSVRLVDSTDLIHCVTHHGRVFYIEKDSQSFWYPEAGAYAGTLTEFDLSQITTTGGDLMYCISWTRDGGAGVDDLAVFVFDTGELVVYSGSDPSSASDWSLVGRFQAAEPLGRRSAIDIGGDVILLTVDGYIPLSALLQEGRYSEQSAFSFKIDTAAKTAAQVYGDNFGWECIHWPQASWFVVNVPISSTQSQQHLRSTTTGAWCKLTGYDAQCWAVYNGNLYFGAPDGVVYQVAGSSDNGDFIEFCATTAFDFVDTPHRKKLMTSVEPITNYEWPKYIFVKLFTDYDVGTKPTADAPPEGEAADWDVGEWDVAEWNAGSTGAKVARRNLAGSGYALSLSLAFKSRAQTVEWHGTNYWFKPAGIV